MRYFKPITERLQPAAPATGFRQLFRIRGKSQGPQEGWDRLGGAPFGLSASSWPHCGECGGPMSFLAQFRHDDDRLDLGRSGRVLFLFFCENDPGMCETWDTGSGANACLILEPEDLTVAPTLPPPGLPVTYDVMNITGWSLGDDGVSADLAMRVELENEELPEELVDQVDGGTKLGGMPLWVQSPEPLAANGWRFLGQIDSVDWTATEEEMRRFPQRGYAGPNFGDSGIAYLRAEIADPRRVVLTWQCC
jgi:hypothetical protein